jgi:hypothetical protein
MSEYTSDSLRDWILGTRADGDIGMAHADAWEKREADARRIFAAYRTAIDKQKADNVALRERLERAKRALDWWDMDTLATALASLPESIPLSPDGLSGNLGETEDKP